MHSEEHADYGVQDASCFCISQSEWRCVHDFLSLSLSRVAAFCFERRVLWCLRFSNAKLETNKSCSVASSSSSLSSSSILSVCFVSLSACLAISSSSLDLPSRKTKTTIVLLTEQEEYTNRHEMRSEGIPLWLNHQESNKLGTHSSILSSVLVISWLPCPSSSWCCW